MNGYMKYSKNGGKNMFFMIENDHVLVMQNEIWNKIKKILYMKFHSKPVYDEEYIKAKVKEFNGAVNTSSLGNEIPKEIVHYTYNLL